MISMSERLAAFSASSFMCSSCATRNACALEGGAARKEAVNNERFSKHRAFLYLDRPQR